MCPDVVNGQNVRVIEHVGSLGFPLEAAQTVGVVSEGNGQDFERHRALESRVTELLAFHRRGLILCEQHGGHVQRRAGEKFCGLDLMRQQLFDFYAQFGVITTGLF